MNGPFFPDPNTELVDDVIAMGLPLRPEIIKEAYSKGIFPWPHDDLPLLWCSPRQRGILEFKDLHLSKSFKKFLKKTSFQTSWNKDFSAVIGACAKVPRPEQSGTWIDHFIIDAYEKMHELGYAHSVEVYEGKVLVGGLYGIQVGKVFAGESMFFKKDNASKLALYTCIETLKSKGHEWMDIQMLTPVTEQFGGKYISRSDFLDKLKKTNYDL